MAKRQNFVVGSTNAVTETMTTSELNNGFDRYEVLTADKLDGTLNSVSDYSNDSSNEIANAIQSITGAQPTGATQTELADALQQMRNEIETTSLTFKGYVATSAPSSSTYALIEGNLWINSATMPTSFPVAASSIKQWNGTSWVNYDSTYTPADFDFFRNINDNEGYYWFGGIWTIMSTDMSTTYFTLNQSTGKWEIKSSVNLPGSPTTTTPAAGDQSTKIATTQFAHDFGQRYVSNCITEIPQDINLVLNNGTLTLKAGSKIYIPNGAGVFDAVTISNDLTLTSVGSANSIVLICANSSGMFARTLSNCVSGPGATTTSGWAYDTTSNKINWYNSNGEKQSGDFSLPLCIVTADASGNVGTLDYVFNGFGYIGASRFFLPNVKALIPNGRNADGTLKTTSYTNSGVKVYSFSGPATVWVTIGSETDNYFPYYEQVEKPSGSGLWYNPDTNLLMRSTDGGATWVQRAAAVVGKLVATTSGQITSFTPKTAFHAVDYSALKDGNNVFTGENKFTDRIVRTVAFSGSASYLLVGEDTNNKGSVFVQAFYTGNKIYSRTGAYNITSNKYAYIDSIVDDSGNADYKIASVTPASYSSPESLVTRDYLSQLARGTFAGELTLLASGPYTHGDITLSQAYTNFDALLILGCNDTSTIYNTNLIFTKEVALRIAASVSNSSSWLLFSSPNVYWSCSYLSTTTSFVSSYENCIINEIYGVKF